MLQSRPNGITNTNIQPRPMNLAVVDSGGGPGHIGNAIKKIQYIEKHYNMIRHANND